MQEFLDPQNWLITTETVILTALGLVIPVLIALAVHWFLFKILKKIVSATPYLLDDAIVERMYRPMRWAMAGFALSIAAHADALVGAGWDEAAKWLTPVLLGWVAYSLIGAIAKGLEDDVESRIDAVAARSYSTRISILTRTAKVAVIIITIALVMLNVPGVRDIGVTMMASAGLAALAVGAAAQPALKSLIAGLQMAITQPLRIGDLVLVDGQAGRVEEIRMSFVTVRTWDERVLVVPTSRFLDESFENWSRVNEQLTGPVMLHLDPIADIPPIRAEFERFVKAHPLFDGRNLALLMTDAYPESVALRLSMSAETIGDLWTLRCETREHMLGWIRENQEEALIRHRLEVPGGHEKAEEPGAP
ncbi:mechanosensitive ion channel family protein [Qipengyuania flava]|uniref:mechanosensitive ion channel family protein n=1 Tax=Qipengyuania flava TaxID=192812 RepID=UPI001C6306CB|nr:mechanosensitive ion channel domain-containing protein [Qipengyuania flava]QYJ07092.1 mechanosensitive ion channel family protein [Qipengyuania flava]